MDPIYSNTNISLPSPCTDMVDSMGLESGVTTTSMVYDIPRLKFFYRSLIEHEKVELFFHQSDKSRKLCTEHV